VVVLDDTVNVIVIAMVIAIVRGILIGMLDVGNDDAVDLDGIAGRVGRSGYAVEVVNEMG
jgi:hypothetical protein